MPGSHRIAIILILSVLFFLSCLTIGWQRMVSTPTSVVLEIETKEKVFFQIFWKKFDTDYRQENSVGMVVTPEKTTYEFKLPGYPAYHTLRFDPFNRPSHLIIKRFSYRVGEVTRYQQSGFHQLADTFRPGPETIAGEAGSGGLTITSSGRDPQLYWASLRPSIISQIYLKTLSFVTIISCFFVALIARLLSHSYLKKSPGAPLLSSPKIVTWLGGTTIVASGIYLVIPLDSLPGSGGAVGMFAMIYLLSVLLFVVSYYLVTRPDRPRPVQRTRWYSWLLYALPAMGVFTLYLGSFWPASMSPDTMNQWHQIVTLQFDDWHPVFHTLFLFLATRIWNSPAMTALLQIAVLAGSFGWGLARLQKLGVSRVILVSTAVLFAVMPVNGLMSITIWKDIPYSAAMLVLSVCLLEIVASNGRWFAYRNNCLVLIGTLTLISLFRHNGLLPAFLTPLVCLALYRYQWRNIMLCLIVAISCHTLVRGPLYSYLDVHRSNPLAYIAAKLEKKVLLALETKDFFAEEKKGLNSPQGKEDEQQQSVGEKLAHSVQLRLNSSSLLWRVKPLQGYYGRVDYVNLWSQKKQDEAWRVRYISGNTLGFSEQPLIPALSRQVYLFFEKTKYHPLLFWMWRPAVFLYILAGAAVIASRRCRKAFYLPLVPIFLNSLPVLFFVSKSSIFRYHYSLILTALLLSIPLLLEALPLCRNSSDLEPYETYHPNTML